MPSDQVSVELKRLLEEGILLYLHMNTAVLLISVVIKNHDAKTG
jgi:hypothetical protein